MAGATLPMRSLYVAAWLLIVAFLGWSVDLLLGIQGAWREANLLHAVRDDLDRLGGALRDLSRPGNDVLERYAVAEQKAALTGYLREFQAAREVLLQRAGAGAPVGEFVLKLDQEKDTLVALASAVLGLAEEREALRLSGASSAQIRERETEAARRMARMDQHLHLGLDVLLAADAALVKREQEIEEQQRGNYGRLYLIMLFTLVVSALSVELLRRSMRQREALREGAARINAIVNNVVDGIVTVDEHGLIESFNPPASRMFGYPSAEVMGRHFSWLLDEPCRPRFQDYLERQAGGGQAGGGRECEELGLRADGSRFPMELAVSRMPMGERTMYVFIVRDITERHRAEENLRQAAGVFENTTEGILITLPDGTIVSVNPAFSAITGYTPQEVIGKTPRVLQSGRQERAFYRQMWESIKTAGHWQGEIWNRRKNGDIYPQWLNINAVRDHHGRTTHFVGITWDISELKASERLKDEFVATVSHELRTPLTSIRGSLGLINGGVAGRIPEQAAGLIRIAYDNCERLVRLINDLLDFEKMEAGKMSFQLRPVELMPLIHQAVQANQPYAAHYGVHLEVSEGPPGACVVADSDRLIQVMNNLLSNAAKYSPRDDVVEVSLQRRGRSLRVAVSDHGSGVPESFRPSVFKKFAQADASATRRKGGTGLGLRICKLIVERLGGEIGFDSEPNVRTTFYFDLPELRLEAGLPRGVELRELSLADRAEEERRQGAG